MYSFRGIVSVLALLMTMGSVGPVGAAEIIGTLSTDQVATVTGQGLEIKVQPGQIQPVFSGDRILAGSGQGVSVLAIPSAGRIQLSPDALISVEQSAEGYLLRVERGEIGFDLIPGSRVALVAGDARYDLGQGTGKGGIAVAPNGGEGYLVLVDASGNIQVIYLETGAIVYQGEAPAELIPAQVGGAGAAGGATGGAGAGGVGGAIGGMAGTFSAIGLGAIPLGFAATVAAVAAAEVGVRTQTPTRNVPEPPASRIRPE